MDERIQASSALLLPYCQACGPLWFVWPMVVLAGRAYIHSVASSRCSRLTFRHTRRRLPLRPPSDDPADRRPPPDCRADPRATSDDPAEMEEYDPDGTPALPFLVPPEVTLEYDVPDQLICVENEILSGAYTKLAGMVNLLLERIHKEPKLYISAAHALRTQEMVAEILQLRGNIEVAIHQFEANGNTAYFMPEELRDAILFIEPPNI